VLKYLKFCVYYRNKVTLSLYTWVFVECKFPFVCVCSFRIVVFGLISVLFDFNVFCSKVWVWTILKRILRCEFEMFYVYDLLLWIIFLRKKRGHSRNRNRFQYNRDEWYSVHVWSSVNSSILFVRKVYSIVSMCYVF